MTVRKCLVTGAAGFIGRNLSHELLKRGYDVHIVDNMSTGRLDAFIFLEENGCVARHADYGSPEVCELVATGGFDVVFHVGAIPRVVYSIEHPAETDANNVAATLRLMEACVGNVGRFVFSSSSAVVGGTDVSFPSNEDEVRMPLSPYALQKATVEDYCRIFSTLKGLETVCLRYFNVFGQWQYADSPYSTVISAWCAAAAEGRPLRLDGDGTQSRDFCYVDNVVDANIRSAESALPFNGGVMNIAHGECRSLNDILDQFMQRTHVTVVRAPARDGDVYKTHADISRARDWIGYTPRVPFDEGLERTFEWWRL